MASLKLKQLHSVIEESTYLLEDGELIPLPSGTASSTAAI